MASNIDVGLFEGVADAKVMEQERTPFLESGTYLLELESAFIVKSQNAKTKGRRYSKAVVKVLEAQPDSVTPVGATAQISLGENRINFLDEAKSLVVMASGNTPEAKAKLSDKKEADKLMATFFSNSPEANARIKGSKFRTRVKKIKTGENKSNDFYLYEFMPASL